MNGATIHHMDGLCKGKIMQKEKTQKSSTSDPYTGTNSKKFSSSPPLLVLKTLGDQTSTTEEKP